jgi:DNA-binding HxlR family transcriptional regulator
MFLGRHEYKDMHNAEEGISSNILTDRLKGLEDGGLISSIPHPEGGRRKLYSLLPKGKDLISGLTHLARWADTHLDDIVHIPPEKRKPLLNNPEMMIQEVLQQLKEWEDQFLIK